MTKRITYILYIILIGFAFFDLMLENSIFSSLMKLKYGIVMILLFIVLKNKQCYWKTPFLNIGFILFYIYHILVGIMSFSGFISEGLSGFMIYKQYFLFPLFMYLFYFCEELTGKSYNQIFKVTIQIAAIYVILNTVFYFIESPVWIYQRKWWGRITLGYPTIDVVSLAISLSILLLNPKLEMSIGSKIGFSILILLGISIQGSGTGFVLIFVCFASALVVVFSKAGQRLFFSYLLMSLIFIFILGINVLIKTNEEVYNNLSLVIENRISVLLGKDSQLGYDTMEMREDHYRFLERHYLRDHFSNKLLGMGFDLVNYDQSIIRSNKPYIYVEDQSSLNLLTGGMISYILYYVFLFFSILSVFFNKKNNFSLRVLGALSFVILGLASYTTFPMGSYSVLLMVAMVYSLVFAYSKENYENRN